jgi:predicted outer membrane repeat protein
VTIVNSTLNGNRADDRGGAISGESDVKIYNSTIARNAAVAHVGGGIWARGDLYIANSTISNNYAEGQGGGVLATGTVGLVHATIADNVAPVGANVGAGGRLEAFGSIIGPAKIDPIRGEAQPTNGNCHVTAAYSFGFNLVTDSTCGLNGFGDLIGIPSRLGPLVEGGGAGETRLPLPDSAALDRIPLAQCRFAPLGKVFEGEQHLAGHVEDVLGLTARDQRGVPRPRGAACDIGATEVAR